MADVVGAVKFCPHCEQTKDVSLFYAKSGRPGQYHCWCKTCHRTYYKAKGPAYNLKFQTRLRREKQAFVHAHKVASGCVDCGETHVACLEHHHLDPAQKSDAVSKIAAMNGRKERIQAELAKCIVLCANCHKKRHWAERKALKEAVA